MGRDKLTLFPSLCLLRFNSTPNSSTPKFDLNPLASQSTESSKELQTPLEGLTQRAYLFLLLLELSSFAPTFD